jgi:cellulose synthase/poly-beta-1,6-N-acetylglucosamine synthase-like glycosyltransferase
MHGAFVWIIFGSSTLIAYTYLGYPLLIGLCARLVRRNRRLERRSLAGPGASYSSGQTEISVILPVYNAAAALPAKIESLLGQDYPVEHLEVLVYCDGCSDDSEAVVRALAERPEAAGRIRVWSSDQRRGKPAAVNALAAEAKGELLLFNDARQPLSTNAARALAAGFDDAGVGCTTGRLVLVGGAGSGAYWRYEDWIRSKESLFRGVVGATGAIAMLRRADFEALPETVLLDDVWMPMRLVLLGKRVVSVREAEAYDTAFADGQEFWRKVRTLAGNYQLFTLLPALLSPLANPLWFETVSHKLLRLLVPWLLLGLLLSSLGATVEQGGAIGVFLVAQLAFYAAAALGARAGRIAGLARTFVVLNAAAAVGLWRFVAGRQRVTW